VIRAEGASRSVATAPGGARVLLHPVHLTIAPGESHLILGANGSGKTTLMRLLSGLTAPSEGRVLVDGVPTGRRVAGRDAPSLWPRVAALFEEPDPQFLADTVEGEVSFGLETLGLSTAEIRARTHETMAEYGVAALASRDPRDLSAGEKARTLLAAAMAARPGALLLDQSLSHLDPGSRRALERRIAESVRVGRLAVVRTHQDADPPFPGERLHVLERGMLRDAANLTPHAVLEARRVPFPLALRASALLALHGMWRGPLAADLPSFVAGLDGVAGHDRAPEPRGIWEPDPADTAAGGGVAIALRGVAWSARGRGGRMALEGVELEARRGEVVALVGASGSGKSTLLQIAAGLRDASRGSVHRAAPQVRRMPPVMLALEYPERQLFARTVVEDVAARLWVEGIPGEQRARRAARALHDVGLDPERFSDRVPTTLSEGEKRRAALAGFLIEPALALLLDEPTAGLDPEGRRAIRVALETLKGRGRAVAFASHDLDFVSAAADRVVVLAREGEAPGRVIGSGPPAEVFADAGLLSRAGLPPPEHVALAESLRARGLLPPGRVRDGDSLLDALARVSAPLT
jgi:energy-coupling factor transport system ATP-binding protein